MLGMLRLQGLYWTLPRDRVEELDDDGSEEDEEQEQDEASAASLVEGSIHSDKPESGGGEHGQPLVCPCSYGEISLRCLNLMAVEVPSKALYKHGMLPLQPAFLISPSGSQNFCVLVTLSCRKSAC